MELPEIITTSRKNGPEPLDVGIVDGVERVILRRCPTCNEPITFERETPYGYTAVASRFCFCQRAENMKRKAEAMRKRGISDAMCRNMRFDADKGYNPAVCRKAKNYVEHWEEMAANNIGIMFAGEVGTGKTFYAACIANALIDKGVLAVMTSLGRVIRTPFDQYEGMLKSLSEADLVVFDDVGTERDTSFAWERAFDAVDMRVRACKPIIVTTNLSPRDMAAAQNITEKRIYDRLLGVCHVIPVTGKSMRITEKKDKAALIQSVFGGK